MSVPHPIPYQGSKRALAPMLLNYIPHRMERLIEPFAGSAALSILAAQQGRMKQFWLNDLNAPLIDLWRSIVDNPNRLSERYEFLWTHQLGEERRFYDLVRERFNKTQRPYYLLYLLARCVKASVRYNTNGEFNQSPDNRRKGKQPNAMRRDIERVAALFKGCGQFSACDYKQVLAQATPNDIVYLDPPYQGVSRRDRRYLETVEFDELTCELDLLNQRNIPYLLSYDGQTGTKIFGQPLPKTLELTRIEIAAGRSSQATLLGRHDHTIESIYLSPILSKKLNLFLVSSMTYQLPLFVEPA